MSLYILFSLKYKSIYLYLALSVHKQWLDAIDIFLFNAPCEKKGIVYPFVSFFFLLYLPEEDKDDS